MSNVATKAKKPNLSVKSVLNWILDHAMIIVIVLLALYVQTQRDAFLKPASLINIISLTAARLPMALGVAGCIILAGTDLTGGRVAGLTAFVAAILLQRDAALLSQWSKICKDFLNHWSKMDLIITCHLLKTAHFQKCL